MRATATAAAPRVTPEDLLAITDRPMPELIHGQLVEREISQKPDAVAFRIGYLVCRHVEERNLGLVNGAQGSYQIFPDDPNQVRIPDFSFTRRERLPAQGASDGHARVAPDLVVEVISPNDAGSAVNTKVEDFLAAGVPLIWVIDPEAHTVDVFRGDGTFGRLRPGAAIDGGDVLPGFHCEVDAFFKGIC
jgi:Uma2 family endonuclease